jgi:hypothetical protein
MEIVRFYLDEKKFGVCCLPQFKYLHNKQVGSLSFSGVRNS